MNQHTRPLVSSLMIAIALSITPGCGNKPAAKKPVGSGKKPVGSDKKPAGKAKTAKKIEHVHGEGPHGGTIADWGGGKYHVEFTVDHDKKEATIYVLGDDAKTAHPIAAKKITLSINDPKFQTDCVPAPMKGEKDGKSSRFVGKHDNLGIVREYEGIISGQMDGTPYSGPFKEEPPKKKK